MEIIKFPGSRKPKDFLATKFRRKKMTEERNFEAIAEAVLFMAGKFLSLNELVMYTNINPLTLKEVISTLEQKYKNLNSAFELVVRGENYKLDVKKEYSYLVSKLAAGKSEFTKAEQETLAIIAYKQPIFQSVVVKIRGNKGYDHVKRLIELGLLKTRKTRHTLELSLSDNFYEYFNLNKGESAEQLGNAVKLVEAQKDSGQDLGDAIEST